MNEISGDALTLIIFAVISLHICISDKLDPMGMLSCSMSIIFSATAIITQLK